MDDPLVAGADPSILSNYLVEFKQAIDTALLQGFEVVRGDSKTLLLDLDTPQDREHFERMGPCFGTFVAFTIKDRWISKSGIGEHVVLSLEKEMEVKDRLLVQAALGSDRIHELLSLVTGVWQDNPEPSVLFKPPKKILAPADKGESDVRA